MAVAALTVVTLTIAGDELITDSASYTAATAADGFQFINNGKTFISIVNADSGTCTATVDCARTCSFGGDSVHDADIEIPAGDDYIIGPFPVDMYNAVDTGYVTISLAASSDVTAISARAISL
jgi:hypothetical protein